MYSESTTKKVVSHELCEGLCTPVREYNAILKNYGNLTFNGKVYLIFPVLASKEQKFTSWSAYHFLKCLSWKTRTGILLELISCKQIKQENSHRCPQNLWYFETVALFGICWSSFRMKGWRRMSTNKIQISNRSKNCLFHFYCVFTCLIQFINMQCCLKTSSL